MNLCLTCSKPLPAPMRKGGRPKRYCDKNCYPPRTDKIRATRKAYMLRQNVLRAERRKDSEYREAELVRDRAAEQLRLLNPDYRAARTVKTRTYKLKHKFNMTNDQYNKLLAVQGGLCACCNRPEAKFAKLTDKLAVDHDHQTGAIRGLLCGTCNSGIGLLGDSVEAISNALRYLRRVDLNTGEACVNRARGTND